MCSDGDLLISARTPILLVCRPCSICEYHVKDNLSSSSTMDLSMGIVTPQCSGNKQTRFKILYIVLRNKYIIYGEMVEVCISFIVSKVAPDAYLALIVHQSNIYFLYIYPHPSERKVSKYAYTKYIRLQTSCKCNRQ